MKKANNKDECQMPHWTVWLMVVLFFIAGGLVLKLFVGPEKVHNKTEYAQPSKYVKRE